MCMNHRELAAGYATYDVKDCQAARKSLRFYKEKSHRVMRREAKHEIQNELEREYDGL
jgi:hypothetical protein